MISCVANEGVRVRPATRCFLCESEGRVWMRDCRDRLFHAPGKWSIRECRSCGLAWLDPQPLPEDVGRLYERYHTHEAGPAPAASRASWKERLARSILAKTLGYAREGKAGWVGAVAAWQGFLRDWAQGLVMWLPHREGRLLDVGCGSGEFLGRMKALGWRVEGLEPDPEAARVASETWGVEVHAGTVEKARLAEGAYDAITLSHVLEHVPDPVAVLRCCGRLLKEDGRLVLTTPNRESLGARRFGADWRGWEVPRHLHVFTTRSLFECARRAGLQVLALRTTARATVFMWLASKALARSGLLPGGRLSAAPLRKRISETLIWVLEHHASRVRPVGEEVLLIARRGRTAGGFA